MSLFSSFKTFFISIIFPINLIFFLILSFFLSNSVFFYRCMVNNLIISLNSSSFSQSSSESLSLFIYLRTWYNISVTKVIWYKITLASDKGNRPIENINEIREHERMTDILELPDVERIVLNEQQGSFIQILITIVRSRKHSDDAGELIIPPLVHFITFQLSLVGTDDRQNLILFAQLVQGFYS